MNGIPIAIIILLAGVVLIFCKSLINSASSTIESGEFSNKKIGLVGPIEVGSSQLQKVTVNYSLRGLATNWCSLNVLLLDENKNVITGSYKDLYFQPGVDEDYEDNDMR